MRIYYYKAVRQIDRDDLIDLLGKIHVYGDENLVKVLLYKGALYFWSSTTITISEVDKTFPDVFKAIDSITFNGEELFTNH